MGGEGVEGSGGGKRMKGGREEKSVDKKEDEEGEEGEEVGSQLGRKIGRDEEKVR